MTATASPSAVQAHARLVSVIPVSLQLGHALRTLVHQRTIVSQQPQLLHRYPQHRGDMPVVGCRLLRLLQCVSLLCSVPVNGPDSIPNREQLQERVRLPLRRAQRHRSLDLRLQQARRLHGHLVPVNAFLMLECLLRSFIGWHG